MLEVRSRRGRVLLNVVTILLLVPFAAPFIVMMVDANQGVGLLANFQTVLARPEVGLMFLSSGIIAVGTIVISYIATMLAAFALAALHHRGKRLITYLMVAALTLPTASIIIPLFYVVSSAGLFDNYAAVFVPLAVITLPFNIILARGFISSIPSEIYEAGRVDGASTWQIFIHLVVPLCRPITAVLIVWTFVAAWNELLLPLVFLQDPAKQTVTLLPTFFKSLYITDQSKVIAASIVVLIPTVVVYLLVQRFFERGITAGAIK